MCDLARYWAVGLMENCADERRLGNRRDDAYQRTGDAPDEVIEQADAFDVGWRRRAVESLPGIRKSIGAVQYQYLQVNIEICCLSRIAL